MKGVMQPPESFQNLEIPRKEIPVPEGLQYCVYSSPKEFVIVTASNAQDAIRVSAIKSPLRVVRHFPTQGNVIEFGFAPFETSLTIMDTHAVLQIEAFDSADGEAAAEKQAGDEAAAAPVAEAAAEAAQDPSSAPAEAPEADASQLSNDEVEKLMNGNS